MRKPKIALVNVFFPPQSIGGATRVLADCADALVREYGDEFELTGFAVDAGVQAAGTVEAYGYRGYRVYRAGARRRVNMDWYPSDAEMGELFAQFLDFERPDLIHFHCVQRLTGSVVEAARDRGIPYLVTVHDAWWISDHQFLVDHKGVVYSEGHPDPDAPINLPEGVSRTDSLQRRAYLKALLMGAERVLAVSHAFAELYRRNGVAHVTVNRNGVGDRAWLPRQPSANGRLRLAHIGGMSRHKGYDLFRDALSGGDFPNLEALVVDLSKPFGYERRDRWGAVPVTFIGKYPQSRTQELYARMDVLVAPSVWPESFGLVTREAALSGAWVVASDRGGIGEDVENGVDGNIVSVDTVDGLAALFERMNLTPGAFVPPGVARMRITSVSEQVRDLVEHYRSLLANAGARGAQGAGRHAVARGGA